MADYAEQITLSDVKLGDRWIGISEIGPVTINELTPSDNLERVVMTFRLGNLSYTLDSDSLTDEIVIDTPATWACHVPARDDFLPRSGKWTWQMQFYFGTDSVWTLYRGVLVCHDGV